ncbi:transposase-like protein [Paraphaeosphaeria sporulosa]
MIASLAGSGRRSALAVTGRAGASVYTAGADPSATIDSEAQCAGPLVRVCIQDDFDTWASQKAQSDCAHRLDSSMCARPLVVGDRGVVAASSQEQQRLRAHQLRYAGEFTIGPGVAVDSAIMLDRTCLKTKKRSINNKKAHKQQKRTSQLDEYFDGLYDDRLTSSASPDLYKLMQGPHRWWVDVGQKRYPVVYNMAMDHLSIPATSCDCEQCFSSVRRISTCDRNQLLPAVVEALQLQKNWLTRDAVSSHPTALSKHVVKKDAFQNIQLMDASQFPDLNTSLFPNQEIVYI